jgi:hypothetical protein
MLIVYYGEDCKVNLKCYCVYKYNIVAELQVAIEEMIDVLLRVVKGHTKYFDGYC